MAHKHTCLNCDAVIAEGEFDCEFDRDHDFELCAKCASLTKYTHTFKGLTSDQVSELIEQFGESCHDWDKVRGITKVDFDSAEDCQNFLNNSEFASN